MVESTPNFNKQENNESLDIRRFRISFNEEDNKYIIFETGIGDTKSVLDELSKEDGELFSSPNGLKQEGKFTPQYTIRKEGKVIVQEYGVTEKNGDNYVIDGTLQNIKDWVEKNIKGETEWQIKERK